MDLPTTRARRRDAAWTVDLGGRPGMGAPALDGGTAVVAVEAYEGAGGALVAVDVEAGRERWRRPLDAAVKHSAVVARDGAVVAITIEGLLLCLDTGSGRVRWQQQLGEPSQRWCYGAPTVDGDGVAAGAASGFGVFDLETGAPRWYRDDLAPEDWMVSWCAPAFVDDVVVASFGNDRVHACGLSLDAGETRWVEHGSELDAPCSPPADIDGLVVVATCNGWLRAFDAATGARRWQSSLDAAWSVAAPAVGGEHVYSISAAGTLAAHRLDDGAPAWTLALGEAPWSRRPYGRDRSGHVGSPVFDAGRVVAPSADGRVLFVDAADGPVEHEIDLGVPLASTPAVASGRVYAATCDGTLFAIAA